MRAHGPNVVPVARRRGLLAAFLGQLSHLLALLLWAAAAMALLAGMPQLSLAIVAIVLLNALFAFAQEYRADRSTQELERLMPSRCHVLRDGVVSDIAVSDLVVDDLVVLAPGDRVGADLVVLDADDLELDESLVTGESEVVVHVAGDSLMAGTFVVQGDAVARVSATGSATTLAGISALTASAARPPSPLARQLARIVRIIAIIALLTATALGLCAVALGLTATHAFLFAVGVAVALVPEGLLPTVTLSLARGARLMAGDKALVRRLDAVETLGATTYICTDKTGTLTQNRMSVVEVVTRAGSVTMTGTGYEPEARVEGSEEALALLPSIASAAVACVSGRVREDSSGAWQAEGDPMEAALDCLARRSGAGSAISGPIHRRPFSPDRMLSSAVIDGSVSVLGAPEQVLSRCLSVPDDLARAVERLTAQGRRVLGVATRAWRSDDDESSCETGLEALGLLAVEDPPRAGVAEALEACRAAGIRVAMLTGDHPRTAAAIGREIGLLGPHGIVLNGPELPGDPSELGRLLDADGGVVVARVTPRDKFRIAEALRLRGHVVAMTGDGVNDAPALREADVGVAMGASGSDVAREASDLVLLDDHFATIVTAVRLGRATFRNVRRFLTYHLSDNVAELAPFVAWALTAGRLPLAIGVLQVLALDIGTDMLPALALGAEPPSERIMVGKDDRRVVDRSLVLRAFAVLGATEAVATLAAFVLVLRDGGWTWAAVPAVSLLTAASGAAFATISVCQMANAFACRSATTPAWRLALAGNPLLLAAVGAQLLMLGAFVGLPPVARALGGSWPPATGWLVAVAGAAALIMVDALVKRWAAGRENAVHDGGRPTPRGTSTFIRRIDAVRSRR